MVSGALAGVFCGERRKKDIAADDTVGSGFNDFTPLVVGQKSCRFFVLGDSAL
jgi:hypothetical protein